MTTRSLAERQRDRDRVRQQLAPLEESVIESRRHVADLKQRQAAATRTAAALTPDSPEDMRLTVQSATILLARELRAAEAGATTALEARAGKRRELLPTLPPNAKLSAASGRVSRLREDWMRSRRKLLDLGERRGRTITSLREASSRDSMERLAADGVERELVERELPAVRSAVAAAEAALAGAREAERALTERDHELRRAVVNADDPWPAIAELDGMSSPSGSAR